MIARAATGSFRDALGTLEQLVTYGGSRIELADVLDVLGVADAELVLEAAEALADHNSRTALLCIERLAASGRDIGQFTSDLAAHLRHVFVTQTLGEVPETFSVTAGHTDRIQSQAERIPEGELLRAIEHLAAALTAVKTGSDPRIQLELALTKAARPEADLRFEALAFRIERLEQRLAGGAKGKAAQRAAPAPRDAPEPAAPRNGSPSAAPGEPARPQARSPASTRPAPEGTAPAPIATPIASPPSESPSEGATAPQVEADERADTTGHTDAVAQPAAATASPSPAAGPTLDLASLRSLWPSVVDAVRAENAMVGALLGEGRPDALDGERLTVALPPGAEFTRRKLIANTAIAQTTLHRLTGRSLALLFELGDGHAENGAEPDRAEPVLSEEDLLERLKHEFGAREIFDDNTPAGEE